MDQICAQNVYSRVLASASSWYRLSVASIPFDLLFVTTDCLLRLFVSFSLLFGYLTLILLRLYLSFFASFFSLLPCYLFRSSFVFLLFFLGFRFLSVLFIFWFPRPCKERGDAYCSSFISGPVAESGVSL